MSFLDRLMLFFLVCCLRSIRSSTTWTARRAAAEETTTAAISSTYIDAMYDHVVKALGKVRVALAPPPPQVESRLGNAEIRNHKIKYPIRNSTHPGRHSQEHRAVQGDEPQLGRLGRRRRLWGAVCHSGARVESCHCKGKERGRKETQRTAPKPCRFDSGDRNRQPTLLCFFFFFFFPPCFVSAAL